MKAIVMQETGASDVLRFEDVAMPTVKKGEVLVTIHAAAYQ